MSNYGIFAQFYDGLTENVDYKVRSDYISDFFHQAQIVPGDDILDLACGTGSITKQLADKGYRMTGLDLSKEMLTFAVNKSPESTFLAGDMTSFDFNEAFDGCVCCLDSINHLTDIDDWKRCFDCVAKSLRKDGLFIFDVNTVYKHQNILGDNAFIFDEEDYFLAWDNELLDGNTVQIYLDFFIKAGEHYERCSESFQELAPESSVITDLLKNQFDIIGIYDDLTLLPEKTDSERLYFVCKRK